MFSFNDESGFTLLEILIAITILTVALIGMAGLLTTNVKSISRGKHQLIALNLAQEKLESIKMLAFSNFNDAAINDSVANNDPLNYDPNVQGTGGDIFEDENSNPQLPPLFRRNTFITDDQAGAGVTNLKDVAVIVDWTDISGPHNIMVRTRIAR